MPAKLESEGSLYGNHFDRKKTMNEKNKVNIIDISGNKLSSHKNSHKIRGFLEKNLWNVLGTGIAFVVTLFGSVRLFIANGYADSCSSYYGVPKRYFDGTEMFYDKILFLAAFIVLIIYPFLFEYINRKIKSRLFVCCVFVVTICLLFIQNISYTVLIIEEMPWDWLKNIIDNYVMIAIFLLADVVLAFYIIVRKEKLLKCWEKVLLAVSIFIYLMDVCMGFVLVLNSDISDKRNYEIINNNQVIVSEYDGKFLTMKCRINDKELVIDKGNYYFVEMTDKDIVYREFEKVDCE